MTTKDGSAGQMTAKQFVATRKQLGLTQARLAEELGMAVFTISRYETGFFKVPKKIELALRYLLSRRRQT